jgi:hypothetical protein
VGAVGLVGLEWTSDSMVIIGGGFFLYCHKCFRISIDSFRINDLPSPVRACLSILRLLRTTLLQLVPRVLLDNATRDLPYAWIDQESLPE